jgi:hypothetical protein
MTVCPIALAMHCIRCPIVQVCPAKTTLGDYGKYNPDDEQKKKEAEEQKSKEQEK